MGIGFVILLPPADTVAGTMVATPSRPSTAHNAARLTMPAQALTTADSRARRARFDRAR
jgi:hypothetical protein